MATAMQGNGFGNLGSSRLVLAAILTGFALHGCTTPSGTSQRPGPAPTEKTATSTLAVSKADEEKKAELCHKGQTISVGESAIPAHLKHGDQVGACPSPCSPSACDDGNLCTSDACGANGACEHTPVSCDDGNTCTTDSCNPETGCEYSPADNTPC